MTRKWFIPLLTGLFVGTPPVYSQQTSVTPSAATPPQPPFVAGVPDDVEWVVDIQNIGDMYRSRRVREILEAQPEREETEVIEEVEERSPDPAVTRFDVRRIYNAYSDGVRREVLEDRQGERVENFISQGRLIYNDPRSGEATVLVYVEDPDYGGSRSDRFGEFLSGHSSRPGHFGEFDWIDPQSFAGVATYNGRECYVFTQSLYDVVHGRAAPEVYEEEEDDFEDARSRAPTSALDRRRMEEAKERMKDRVYRTAFIDRETKLPVGLEDRFTIRLYQFGELDEPISLPDRFVSAIEQQIYESQRLQRRYSVPQ